MEEKNKSEKKKDFESVKKTVEAHKTFSEEESEKKASKIEEVSKELVEKDEKEIEKPEIVEKKEDKKSFFERAKEEELLNWVPKTKLGKEVRDGVIKNIDEIIDNNKKILEEQIVDILIKPKTELALIGQSKGKFGGGKRRIWRQTQKKTKEGNVPVFSAMAIIGDEDGHVGIGVGKAMETLPARDKSLRNAKLNVIKIKRACSSFDCDCEIEHTIPFKISGKGGSVRVDLIPAPQGTGLVAGSELKKLLKLAGIKDVYSKTFGKKRTTFNLVKAGFDALKKTNIQN